MMILNDFYNFLFPIICASCDNALLKSEDTICTVCRTDLPLTQDYAHTDTETYRVLYGRVDVDRATSLLFFEKQGLTQELMHDLKYRGNQNVSRVLGFWHGELLKNAGWNKFIDVVVPVPLHKQRMRKRGFNQVEKYGRAIAEVFDINYNNKILKRKSATKTQVFKSRLARTDVTEKNFYLNDFDDALKGKHFLLVDDIITTGATLETCVNELLQIEGASVSIATMAITK
ncbi:MAG: ComF family protein [Bacteroidota bacterium]